MKFQKMSQLIKSIRQKAGITQEELSRLLGLDSPQFISNVERGTSSIPAARLSKIKALATKEQLLRAYLEDVKTQWLNEYEGN